MYVLPACSIYRKCIGIPISTACRCLKSSSTLRQLVSALHRQRALERRRVSKNGGAYSRSSQRLREDDENERTRAVLPR